MLLVALALLLEPSYGTGTQLLKACESRADQRAVLSCDAYIMGFVDAAIQYEVVFDMSHATAAVGGIRQPLVTRWGICIPDESTEEQFRRVIVKYLGDHPERLHQPRGNLMLDALIAAFPCTKEK